MKLLEHSIVIATRNRPAALRLSIPRMLSQSRPPAQLIVVDSSDDHLATVAAVKESVGDHSVELTILHSERGLTRQRNLGLKLVTTPVVFFPDDDSIWFPGVAEAQMEVYEKDVGERISAVCAAESPAPPLDWEVGIPATYQMRGSHRLQQRFAAIRSKIENTLLPDPAKLVGKSFWPANRELPQWFSDQDVVLVEWMTGFRMSFRTSVIRVEGFDETFSRYSLFEDIDASFSAWKHGWVVGARKARVFHYRSPEKRDQGRRLGVEQLLNKAYVVVKHTTSAHAARRGLGKFARYKVFQYFIGARDEFGRERYEGAAAALASLSKIASVHDPGNLSATYINLVSEACEH
jgi:glycosyltransferase involved in cell wall biosynthesis